MKFNMMIGGVETLFPETEVRYDKKENEVIIFFLGLKKDDIIRTEKKINKSNLRIEENYLILRFEDFQYAYDLNKNKKIMNLYMNGASLGFAFEDENGNMLDIATPRYSNEI